MTGNTRNLEMGKSRGIFIFFQRPVKTNAEFVLLESCRNIGMGLWINVRIHPDGDIRLSAQPSGGLGVFVRASGEDMVSVSFSGLEIYDIK